jgi:hypothetical protein
MGNRSLVRSAAWAALVVLAWAGGRARADDFEKDLLRKYQQQNQKGSLQVTADVEKNLARALALSPLEPEKALQILRQTKELLDGADALPRADRDALNRRLADAFRDAKARLESQALSTSKAPVEKVANGGIIFQPNNVPIPSSASFTATPVVLPDRRWVRIGVSGTFTGLTGLRLTPVQIPVPTLLQGPGGRLILVR